MVQKIRIKPPLAGWCRWDRLSKRQSGLQELRFDPEARDEGRFLAREIRPAYGIKLPRGVSDGLLQRRSVAIPDDLLRTGQLGRCPSKNRLGSIMYSRITRARWSDRDGDLERCGENTWFGRCLSSDQHFHRYRSKPPLCRVHCERHKPPDYPYGSRLSKR